MIDWASTQLKSGYSGGKVEMIAENETKRLTNALSNRFESNRALNVDNVGSEVHCNDVKLGTLD